MTSIHPTFSRFVYDGPKTSHCHHCRGLPRTSPACHDDDVNAHRQCGRSGHHTIQRPRFANIAITLCTNTCLNPAIAIAAQKFDLAISVHLHLWPALTLAVANQWGGPSSADKREWLAGAISDLFNAHPTTDAGDVEDLLLQVMGDEFDVGLEDESEEAVAAAIVKSRKECEKGDFAGVDALYERWRRKGGKADQVQWTDNGEQQDTDGDEDDDADADVDTQMDDADMPEVAQVKEKAQPEVDEDGFVKVVGRRKR